LQKALVVADQNEERKFDLSGFNSSQLLLSRIHISQAQLCLERAIEIARMQGGKLFELHATISLARLSASQGSRDEARADARSDTTGSPEDLDTPDLKTPRRCSTTEYAESQMKSSLARRG
jgi:hypothetical protein